MDTNLSVFVCVCPRLSVLSICPVSTSSFQLIRIKCLTATNSKLLGCLPFILIKLCLQSSDWHQSPAVLCHICTYGRNEILAVMLITHARAHTNTHAYTLTPVRRNIASRWDFRTARYPCHMFVTHITSFHFPLMWLQRQQLKAASVPHHDWGRISVFTLVKGVNAIFWRLP